MFYYASYYDRLTYISSISLSNCDAKPVLHAKNKTGKWLDLLAFDDMNVIVL